MGGGGGACDPVEGYTPVYKVRLHTTNIGMPLIAVPCKGGVVVVEEREKG